MGLVRISDDTEIDGRVISSLKGGTAMVGNTEYYPPNTFRVCIDRIDGDISGRIYSPLSPTVIAFDGIDRMLLKMDGLFDKAGYPQAFQEKRSFSRELETGNRYMGLPKIFWNAAQIRGERGKLHTLDIEVCSRRNTTWQGSVYKDGEKRMDFSGDMELLKLLRHGSKN